MGQCLSESVTPAETIDQAPPPFWVGWGLHPCGVGINSLVTSKGEAGYNEIKRRKRKKEKKKSERDF